jgi:hypothetical protein
MTQKSAVLDFEFVEELLEQVLLGKEKQVLMNFVPIG